MESFLDDSEAETDASFLADSSEEDTKKKKSSKISEDEDDDLSLSEVEEVGPRRTRGTRRNDKDEKADENGADKTEKEKKNFAGEVVKKWKTRSRTKDGTYGECAQITPFLTQFSSLHRIVRRRGRRQSRSAAVH